jgi:hypothetical protein
MKTSCDYNIDKEGETPPVTSLVLKSYLSGTYKLLRSIRPSSGTPAVFKVLRKIKYINPKNCIFATTFQTFYTQLFLTLLQKVSLMMAV